MTVTKPFTWIPGIGPDAEVLARMEDFFPKPTEPMGEAWFMGEKRKMFTALCKKRLSQISTKYLQDCLTEIAGTSAFGPRAEWDSWYHYLLPRLIPRCFENYLGEYLVEYLITALITVYPVNILERYMGFREDVLCTLGQVIMDPSLWNREEIIVGKMLHRAWPEYAERPGWGWHKASGDFSAMMFLCWKYLDAGQIDRWLQSVFAIRSTHWQAQLLVWLLGSRSVSRGEVTQPAQFDKVQPEIDWAYSHTLDGHYDGNYQSPTIHPFLSAENLKAFRKALQRYLTPDMFLQWVEAIEKYPYLKEELCTLPDQFMAAFFSEESV